MYEEFYGLHSKPFQLNPDPNFYYASQQHQRAKSYLDYGVVRNEGFIVVTGEIGAGKTTIVRGLLDNLEASSVVAAQLVSTQLDAEDMLRLVAAAFGVRTKNVSKAELLMALEVFFVSQVGQGKRCLLIIDEAQNLTPRAVEELRMLSNFQFGKQALLQSFLVGQPEFRKILQDPRMEQLRQRVIAACHIGPLDSEETKSYILHRLKISGAYDFSLFQEEAYKKIYVLSRGIPRQINAICDRLLLMGFLENRKIFEAEDVDRIAQEIRDENGENSIRILNSVDNSLNPINEDGTGDDNVFLRSGRDKINYVHELENNNLRFQQLERAVLRLEQNHLEILSTLGKTI